MDIRKIGKAKKSKKSAMSMQGLASCHLSGNFPFGCAPINSEHESTGLKPFKVHESAILKEFFSPSN